MFLKFQEIIRFIPPLNIITLFAFLNLSFDSFFVNNLLKMLLRTIACGLAFVLVTVCIHNETLLLIGRIFVGCVCTILVADVAVKAQEDAKK